MDCQTTNQQITAIVPAFNEGPRLQTVLDVLTTYTKFTEVIVVDDGSIDATATVAQSYPVRLLRNKVNLGKGLSMDRAVKAAGSNIIFFCDADVKGLNHQIIDRIVQPVISGKVDMFIGMRNRKIYWLRKILTFIPLLGGERALTRSLWLRVPDWYKDRFKIEAALNFYAIHYGEGLGYAVFVGLSQTMKEIKYGWWTGFKRRIVMYYEVAIAQLRLETTAMPIPDRKGQATVVSAVTSFGALIAGGFILTAAYFGPVFFMSRLFAKELREDPDAPLVHTLLWLSSRFSVQIIAAVGVLIVTINLVFFVVRLQNSYAWLRGFWKRRQQEDI